MNQREESKRRTRAVLLDAARTVIHAKGFPATTARDVATAAGVAVGTVFVHFPTMAALAETLLDETIGEALAAAGIMPAAGTGSARSTPRSTPQPGSAHSPAGAPRSTVERLVAVSAVLYDAYAADADLSRDVIAASLFHQAPGGPADQRLRAFQLWVEEQVKAGQAAGELGDINPTEAFLGFFSLYFGVLVAGLRGQLDRPAQLRMLRSSLLRLLGANANRKEDR